jgi:hypothetical protein
MREGVAERAGGHDRFQVADDRDDKFQSVYIMYYNRSVNRPAPVPSETAVSRS